MNYLETFRTVLKMIEEQDKLSINSLSSAVFMSDSHLQRLFRQTTSQSMMSYARSRKLARSLEDLLSTDERVIDIADKYGFNHEQSYIRSFRREYGCTPGEARKNKHILPIREYIAPDQLYSVDKGFMYGPEHIISPSFFIIGKPALLKDFDADTDALLPNMIGRKAFYEVLDNIEDAINPEVYIGLCNYLSEKDIEYMPGVEVKDLSRIPDGMKGWTFPVRHCVRFRYIGKHSCEEISMITARDTYAEIIKFFANQARYAPSENYHYERIDSRLYDGVFCQMDLIIPVLDKL